MNSVAAFTASRAQPGTLRRRAGGLYRLSEPERSLCSFSIMTPASCAQEELRNS